MLPTPIPSLIYGTAWKKSNTAALVLSALQSGFRAIDTAAQPKHYREDLVGQAICQYLQPSSSLSSPSQNPTRRSDLYIQTKYTSPHGHDPADLPPGYVIDSSISEQVHASIASSLRNLRPTAEGESGSYLDCLVLHSPFPEREDTLTAWRTMEAHHPHHVLSLGLSNCYDLPTLRFLYTHATVKPSVLQNRFYRETDYDQEVREFCRERRIRYQSFWTLTANPHLLKSEAVTSVARSVGVGRVVALYALVAGLPGEVSVLNGTTNVERMREDIEGMEKVKNWKEANGKAWKGMQDAFEAELG